MSEPVRGHRRAVLIRIGFLVVAALVLYGFLPTLTETYGELPQLADVRHPGWFLPMVGFEVASFACSWAMVRLALPTVPWSVAATAQLTGNALSRVVPGGAAVGGAGAAPHGQG